ncbi:MAG TPA: S9 family peptidase, partial [Candidatus Agrococcus pullicola]|nr:S9 family peptidase [Candidatus Agrococcus pullicola]
MADTSITDLLDAARLSGLITTPKGRIVAQVSRLNTAGTAYRSELAELIDDEVVTLTRGSASIGSVALAEDGSTLFTSKRVGEDGKEADDAQLWALPPRGEARELASRPGGFGKLHLGGGRLVAELSVHSQASSESEHADLAKQRKEAKVTASLTSEFPTRYWDQDLGPARQILAVAELPEDLWTAEATSDPDSAAGSDDKDEKKRLLHFRHVTMPHGRLHGWIADRAGTRALATVVDSVDDLLGVYRVYLLDLTGSEEPRLVLDASAEYEFGPVEFSPDGSRVVVGQHRTWTETESLGQKLFVWNTENGELTDLWPEFDHWAGPVWLDDETLVAGSDDQGRGSVWIGGLDDTAPRRLAGGP